MNIYTSIIAHKQKNKKQFAVLIDPDKESTEQIVRIANRCQQVSVDYIFVGGSLLVNNSLTECIGIVKSNCNIPVVLFPGNTLFVNDKADGILLLSLISGRNAEMLIGKHVIIAPLLKKSSLEIIPTGYILVDSGKPTTALYMSNSLPVPADKDDIAMCTAMAGEMLGLKMIYVDAGSGAANSITQSMISRVRENITIPLIVGGGIKTPEKAAECCKAGADLIVVGNAVEKDMNLIISISEAIHQI